MWKKLKDSILFITYSDEYKVYVTDYVSIWCTCFSKMSFLRCLKDSNCLLEMSDESLLQKGLHVLSNPDSLKSLDIKHEDTSLLLNMTMQFGYPFKLNLKLCKGSNELFFTKVTQPILKTVLELKNSQLELCKLLKKKDSEIEEYKCEGGEIALKHLKTKPFNEESVLSKYMSFEEQFGSTNDLLHGLIQAAKKIPEDDVKQENNDSELKVKLEAKSQHSNQNIQAPVKIEPSSQNIVIKGEPNSQVLTAKIEPSSQLIDTESISSVNATINIKQESELSIKRESQSMSTARKKVKKLF